MKFSERALRVAATLEGFSSEADDFLDALTPFFLPLLKPFKGRILSAELIAKAAVAAYGWHITSDVIEELSPR